MRELAFVERCPCLTLTLYRQTEVQFDEYLLGGLPMGYAATVPKFKVVLDIADRKSRLSECDYNSCDCCLLSRCEPLL